MIHLLSLFCLLCLSLRTHISMHQQQQQLPVACSSPLSVCLCLPNVKVDISLWAGFQIEGEESDRESDREILLEFVDFLSILYS